MSRKPRQTIQVYDSKKYLTGNGFLGELNKHLASINCGLVVRDNYSEVDKSDALLVLCNLWSRVGTDFDRATLELQQDISLAHVAVVVVHEKDVHALPSTMTKDALLEEKYDQYGMIVDLAYTPFKKLYPCTMNKTGYQLLWEFIQEHAKLDETLAVITKEENVSVVQIFCQDGNDVAVKLVTDFKTLVEKDKDINIIFHELSSIIDREWSTDLVAIFDEKSPVLKEILKSEEIKKHQTILIILCDKDDLHVEHGEPLKIYLNSKRKEDLHKVFDKLTKELCKSENRIMALLRSTCCLL